MSRRRDDPKYRGSGYFSAIFLTLALLGWAFPHEDTEPPAGTDCTPIPTEEYPEARDTLLAQGFHPASADTLVRPGCTP